MSLPGPVASQASTSAEPEPEPLNAYSGPGLIQAGAQVIPQPAPSALHHHHHVPLHDPVVVAAHPPPTESEQRVVHEFTQLLDKSKQLFNGIRDLPLHGTKQWQGYFGRTFDLYTRLWKFQQQHRQVLDRHYGLKRWQIGEVASKIGQLYYHYYLRTSETTYLLETFSFYSAVRSRAYYSNISLNENFRPDLTVKKLRYYARFIVVCLLLKKLKLVRDLVRELSRLVEDYINRYDPEDQLEWSMILQEIKSFVEADNIVSIVDVDNSTVVLSHRLTPYNTPPLEKGVPFKYTLQEVILVGNCVDQVKCTELSLDMFWMLQALEREPHEDLAMGDDVFIRTSGKENPHKYLLYKPTFSQLLLFLSSGYRDLPSDGAMLLYISADGCFTGGQSRSSTHGYDVGGVTTALPQEMANDQSASASLHNPQTGNRDIDWWVNLCELCKVRLLKHGTSDTLKPVLMTQTGGSALGYRPSRAPKIRVYCKFIHPGDLYPYSRKPFVLVVDSDNSSVFLGMPNLFNQPLITFASPVDLPAYLQAQPKRGSVFSLFLHSPLTAFCYICNISEIPIALWDKCQAHVDKFTCDAGRLLVRCPKTDRSYIELYSDDFVRLIILRFIFCACVLRLHRSFRLNPALQPHCHPPVPQAEVLQHPNLTRLVLDLACILDVLAAFRDTEESVC